MMNSLCQIFDISINELLSGERISTEELQIRAEKNIKELIFIGCVCCYAMSENP